ncbi:MAG: hypothetical protein SF051_08335 [Elusimicrobiota bacterium]|nr:hypothetical protein [Elusimicrobiota bacterium]
MKKLPLLLTAVVVFVAAGCDFREKRDGVVTLAGSANIPLTDRSGARAELVAGPAEVTFKKGSADNTVAIRIRQDGRPEVNFEAAVSGDYRTGNFTLRGSDIGQPVDMASARSFAITGPTRRETTWTDEGNRRCLVDYTYDPCAEDWTVDFRTAAGSLGSFASRKHTRCNEQRGFPHSCHYTHPEPRLPDYPRHPRGGRGFVSPASLDATLSLDAEKVKFD